MYAHSPHTRTCKRSCADSVLCIFRCAWRFACRAIAPRSQWAPPASWWWTLRFVRSIPHLTSQTCRALPIGCVGLCVRLPTSTSLPRTSSPFGSHSHNSHSSNKLSFHHLHKTLRREWLCRPRQWRRPLWAPHRWWRPRLRPHRVRGTRDTCQTPTRWWTISFRLCAHPPRAARAFWHKHSLRQRCHAQAAVLAEAVGGLASSVHQSPLRCKCTRDLIRRPLRKMKVPFFKKIILLSSCFLFGQSMLIFFFCSVGSIWHQ